MPDENPNEPPPLRVANAILEQNPGNAGEVWSSFVALHAAAVLVGLWAYSIDPAGGRGYLSCPFNQWTGWYCPGCGGQRALHAVLHGHLAEAMGHNLFAVLVVAPLGAYGYARYVVQVMWGKPVPVLLSQRVVWGTVAVLAVAFAIVRNLPLPVGQWLAP